MIRSPTDFQPSRTLPTQNAEGPFYRVDHERPRRSRARTTVLKGPSGTRPSLLCGRYRHNKVANFARFASSRWLVWVEITDARSQTLAGLRVAPGPRSPA
jgi:hypothetical protein